MQKFVESLNADKLTFAFNRRDSSADIIVALDLKVKDTDDSGRKTYSPQMVLDFYQCSKDLLKAAR